MTAAAARSLPPSSAPVDAPDSRSLHFTLWNQANQLVPPAPLFFWLARPGGGQAAATLRHLTHVDFVYNLSSNFVAHLSCRDGVFSSATILRESPSHTLLALPGIQNLNPPEAAERALELYLQKQKLEFWHFFFREAGINVEEILRHEDRTPLELLHHRYGQLPWQSLRLERPLRAENFEPVYKFRKAHSRCEFVVGAIYGGVRHEHVIEQRPPAVSLPPWGP